MEPAVPPVLARLWRSRLARLAGILRPSTGYALPVADAGAGSGGDGGVSLLLTGADPVVGSQGYQLDVTGNAVVIRARTATGLFNGVQTLRQLLPPRIESATALPGPWTVRGGRIVDYPRFPFSSLCTTKESTYAFVKDVLGEVAALTPGPYLHIGGDEARSTPSDQYAAFMNRVQPTVAATGKTVMGWHQIGEPGVRHEAGRVLQYWGRTDSDPLVTDAVSRGARVVMSPADKTYLDMKYTSETGPGQRWAGYIEVRKAYDWDPGTYLSGVPASAVLGVEAPLWTEAVSTEEEIEYMAFPRLPAIAELGWSPWAAHAWGPFERRLGAQASRWTIMGIDFHRSPQVSWDDPAPGQDATATPG
ncbi:family 20 glycosylhydrolase [Streptosporangium sp. NPDC051023]|uniref:family 20 glycosylhydrolase n=1 Tax=Streptosporangium sp. NPDC051023 TaxID=3155410 RepID=UPI00344D1D13